MKKYNKCITALLVTAFLGFSVFTVFSIMPPKKNKTVGGIIGKINIVFDKDWNEVSKGVHYYDFWIKITDKRTKKTNTVIANKYGHYYLFNLQPGEYIVKECSYEYQSIERDYSINKILFGENGVNVTVESGAISVVKDISIKAAYNEKERSFMLNVSVDDTTSDNIKESFYKNIDKTGYWKNYKWLGVPVSGNNDISADGTDTMDRSADGVLPDSK